MGPVGKTCAVLAAWGLGSYGYDVILRPALVARRARLAAQARRKPLLNIGAGTPSSSLRVLLLGPTLWGDCNLDLASQSVDFTRGQVGHGDAHRLPFENKTFGAVIASHVLEHVDEPVQVLRELDRVSDELFVITPPWWCPHTWLHPGHQWYVDGSGCFHPLWRRS